MKVLRASYRERDEWGVGNTKTFKNREWRVASGEWRVASGEWAVASGEWQMIFSLVFSFPTPESLSINAKNSINESIARLL